MHIAQRGDYCRDFKTEARVFIECTLVQLSLRLLREKTVDVATQRFLCVLAVFMFKKDDVTRFVFVVFCLFVCLLKRL